MKKVWSLGLALVAAAVGVALAYRAYAQRRVLKRTRLQGVNAIDTTMSFRVYGTTLKGLVRGENKRNPILLIAHGGPGTPEGTLAREYDRHLVRDFVVVRYDQRGTGRSPAGRVAVRDYTIELFVEDLLRVAAVLRERFPDQTLLLVGNSWGSVLAMIAAKEQPSLFDAYIGVSQVIDMRVSDPLSYDFALDAATMKNNKVLVRRLKKLNRNSYFLDYKQMRIQRHALFQLGGVMLRKDTRREMLSAALRSPDYGLVDLLRTVRGAAAVGRRLYPQMALTNMFEEVDELKMPVYFIEGKEDKQVSPDLVVEFMKRLRAPRKHMLWVDGAGHFFGYEKPIAFYERLLAVKEDLGFSSSNNNNGFYVFPRTLQNLNTDEAI